MFLSVFPRRSTSSNAFPREKNPGEKIKNQKSKKKTPPLNEKHEIQQYCYASHFLKGERKTGSDW
jgi:hypothetical protein